LEGFQIYGGAGFKSMGSACVCCSVVFSLFIEDLPQCFGELLMYLDIVAFSSVTVSVVAFFYHCTLAVSLMSNAPTTVLYNHPLVLHVLLFVPAV